MNTIYTYKIKTSSPRVFNTAMRKYNARNDYSTGIITLELTNAEYEQFVREFDNYDVEFDSAIVGIK